ncbi:MAG: pantoate--beta-alanine ligase [Deltaproteobacteria bacterium]|nr:pantoate--beta-alanine ligase [Deltaproteobacteria bacterium]
MKVIKTVHEMQAFSLSQRTGGKSIALVPTMGYLHDGHISLLSEARKHGDLLVMSLFVNPMQFGPQEDLAKYPRDFARDTMIAESAGTDIIFYPEAREMYPEPFRTTVYVSDLSDILCGKTRPGHFGGVTTVVAKLFNVILPHSAIFGEKDFQQLVILRRMVKDLNMPVEIIGMPIIREPDGLAMSSRNTYLSVDDRRRAISISKGLSNARDAFHKGVRDEKKLQEIVRSDIQSAGLRIDYVEVIDETTLQPVHELSHAARIVVAAYAGNVRLIDNMALN